MNQELTGEATVKGFGPGGQVGIEAIGRRPFKTEQTHTLLTGEQTETSKYTFGVLLGAVTCDEMSVDGTVAVNEVTKLTLKPAYGQCEGVERQVTTHMNGCGYVLDVADEPGTTGEVEIECPAGKAIETTVDKFPEGCTLTIGAQTAGGVVDYKEEGSGKTRDLLLTWTLTGIDYTRDGCEIGGAGNNGTYSGSVTLEAENTSGEQTGIWIE